MNRLPYPHQNMMCCYRLDGKMNWLTAVKVRDDQNDMSIDDAVKIMLVDTPIHFPDTRYIFVIESLDSAKESCSGCGNEACADRNKPRSILKTIFPPAGNLL